VGWKTIADLAVDAVMTAFRQDAVYNGGETIGVIFSREYTESTPFDESFASSRPVATVKNSDVPALAVSDTFLIDGVTYTARSIEQNHDGTALVVLAT